ncbi:hypothetical protein ACSQ67_017692 [Phaseolus vulgaris]
MCLGFLMNVGDTSNGSEERLHHLSNAAMHWEILMSSVSANILEDMRCFTAWKKSFMSSMSVKCHFLLEPSVEVTLLLSSSSLGRSMHYI